MGQRSPQARAWMMTIMDADDELKKEQFEGLFENAEWTWDKESAPTTGMIHYHIYAEFRNPVMRSTIENRLEKILGTAAWVEKRAGSRQDAIDYVGKKGKWEFDEKADTVLDGPFFSPGFDLDRVETPGQRTDLTALHDAVYSGMNLRSIMADADLSRTAAHVLPWLKEQRKSFLAKSAQKRRSIEAQYYFGETGTGKSMEAFERFPSAYRITDYQHPFDGYDGESTIIFEEFAEEMSIQQLLKVLDSYPLVVPARYSSPWALWNRVIFTSNVEPWELYKDALLSHRDALFRRLGHGFYWFGTPNQFDFFDAPADWSCAEWTFRVDDENIDNPSRALDAADW